MSSYRWRVRGAGLAAALALAGCGSGRPAEPDPAGARAGPSTEAPSTALPSSGTASPTVVPEALRFASPLVAGGSFDGASLAGKPAVLWFWAAWCPRCQAKAADVRAAQAATAGKVNFVGVAGLSSGQDAMARFVSQHELGGFPQLADDTGTVWRHFGVVEQEYFVLIDASGVVVHKGPLSVTDLNRRVADLAG